MKGEATKSTILRKALDLSSEAGLEGLSIGMLAGRVGMSKSGLYAHFGSKEDLQSQVLDAAADRFVASVLSPALKQPRGRPRLIALFENWLDWTSQTWTGGCPFIAASTEFDDRPGPVREHLIDKLRDLFDAVARAVRAAMAEGHFRSDLDADQFAYEFWGIVLAYHHYARLMQTGDARGRANEAFARLLRDAEPPSR